MNILIEQMKVLLLQLISVFWCHVPPTNLGEQEQGLQVESSPAVGFRLPRHVVPIKYHIRLDPNVTNLSSEGFTKIQVKVTRPTKMITIHVDKQYVTILKTNVKSSISTLRITDDKKFNEKRKFLSIILRQRLWPKEIYELDFHFKSKILPNDKPGGFFMSKDKAGNWLLATQMQPSVTRNVFPCFDEPWMKANLN